MNINVAGLTEVYRDTSLSTSKIENSRDDAELMEACKEFESYFLTLMFKEMRKTINYSDGYIKRNRGEEIFTDLLDEEVGKTAANGDSGMGLAQILYEQMRRKT